MIKSIKNFFVLSLLFSLILVENSFCSLNILKKGIFFTLPLTGGWLYKNTIKSNAKEDELFQIKKSIQHSIRDSIIDKKFNNCPLYYYQTTDRAGKIMNYIFQQNNIDPNNFEKLSKLQSKIDKNKFFLLLSYNRFLENEVKDKKK